MQEPKQPSPGSGGPMLPTLPQQLAGSFLLLALGTLLCFVPGLQIIAVPMCLIGGGWLLFLITALIIFVPLGLVGGAVAVAASVASEALSTTPSTPQQPVEDEAERRLPNA